MKFFINIIFLLLTNIIGHSQNWQSVKIDAITYFSSDSTNIRTIRIDSTKVFGDTTDYISFHMLRQQENQTQCYSIYGESWIGEKIRVLPNGYNIFFNKYHKQINIKTNALYGEAWNLYNYSSSYFVEAKIILIDTMNILGIIDSIKVISLQLKDSNNISINYVTEYDSVFYINTSQLILSKNFGFVQIFDFYKFPVNNSSEIDLDMFGYGYIYKLIGISNPSLGYQNLTASEIFNFNVNDEIHILDVSYYSPFSSYAHSTQTIDKYLSKIISLNNDTITYIIDRCYFTSSYNNGVIDSIASRDTIQFKFIVSDPQYFILNSLPMEPCINWSNWTFNSANKTNKYWGEFYMFFSYNNDFTCLNRIYYDPEYYRYYAKGLGGPYYHYFETITNQENRRNIVYYKKGNSEYGVPYNCNTLLKIDNNEKLFNKNYLVFPNPTRQYLYIKSNQDLEFNSYLMIIDKNGKIVYKSEFKQYKDIDVSTFSNGLYVVMVLGRNYSETHKIVIE